MSDDESHDLGYGLCKEFWHRSIVAEACQSAVSQLKRSGLSYLTATHDIKNSRTEETTKNKYNVSLFLCRTMATEKYQSYFQNVSIKFGWSGRSNFYEILEPVLHPFC